MGSLSRAYSYLPFALGTKVAARSYGRWAAPGSCPIRAVGSRTATILAAGAAHTGRSPPFNYNTEAQRFTREFSHNDGNSTQVTLLADKNEFMTWLGALPAPTAGWLKAIGHDKYKPGRLITVPDLKERAGGIAGVGYCLEESADSVWAISGLFDLLPEGKYVLASASGGSLKDPNAAALSWALSAYTLERYKQVKGAKRKSLVWPKDCNIDAVSSAAAATYIVRDLISTPAEDMGPQHLETVVENLAQEFGADLRVIKGDDLLKENYPMIHAVGRAAAAGREPRLLDMLWGDDESKPLLTLVGKGVCFDTGGLDIKPSAAMLTMKKDMGGAAQTIGLARMVMARGSPVRLRVLIAAVENSISGSAFRPGDILMGRNGKSTEVGNTDAEGRLVLADSLVRACEEKPDLIIDCATLTGAARVAMGTDVPALFCNDDDVANRIMAVSAIQHDHVWRLPLWEGYRKQLSSKIADIKNVPSGSYGGAITAALYLDEFICNINGKKPKWVHLDFMAYNLASRPGRPEGGEAQGMRALFAYIEERYGAPDHYPL